MPTTRRRDGPTPVRSQTTSSASAPTPLTNSEWLLSFDVNATVPSNEAEDDDDGDGPFGETQLVRYEDVSTGDMIPATIITTDFAGHVRHNGQQNMRWGTVTPLAPDESVDKESQMTQIASSIYGPNVITDIKLTQNTASGQYGGITAITGYRIKFNVTPTLTQGLCDRRRLGPFPVCPPHFIFHFPPLCPVHQPHAYKMPTPNSHVLSHAYVSMDRCPLVSCAVPSDVCVCKLREAPIV